jgi:Flp pilus assembly protein TadG
MGIRDERGAAAVEFAIVCPVLVLLVFGMIEFGLLLYNQQVITNASREGARFGIVAPDAGGQRRTAVEIQGVVDTYCGSRLVTFGDGGSLPTTATTPNTPTTHAFGEDLTVTVTYPYGFLVLQNLGFEPVTLQAQTVMKYE